MSTPGIKLYVDDIRPCPDGWVLARTITEAIRILALQDVSVCSLDHDICHAILPGDDHGSNIYQPVCCPETYEAVAWYISLMPKERRPKVKFHTANPAGRAKMQKILEES